ncbi:AP2 domain protein [compost metagenome]
MPKRIDLTDRQFGELYVIRLSDQRDNNNKLLWECRCSCGKLVYLHGYSLLHDYYKSCGCKRSIKLDQGVKEHIKRDRIDGTRKTALTSKLHKGNKSGVKGVRWNEHRQKWTAHIGFQGKQINLGYFNDKEDAIKERMLAEDKYHKPILEDADNEQ